MTLPPDPCPHDAVLAAGREAVEIAAVAYVEDQDDDVLNHHLLSARGHGLTVDELCEASGLDETFVRQLLDEAG